jgi:hypothetical protein
MPSRLRLNGTQTSRKIPASHRAAGRGWSNPPTSSSWKRGLVPPPGPSSTIRASPARMKLAARVTTMSGTPETTATVPMMPDRTMATTTTSRATSTTGPRSCSSMRRAAMQLVRTIIAPTDRSIPPEMTITVWAMASRARVMVPATMPRTSKAPKAGIWEERHRISTPSSTATPTTQPWRRTNRSSRPVGRGSGVVATSARGVAVIPPSPPVRGRR